VEMKLGNEPREDSGGAGPSLRPTITLAEVVDLYQRFATDLKRVRNFQKHLYDCIGEPEVERRLKRILPLGLDPFDDRGGWIWGFAERMWSRIRPDFLYMHPMFDDLDSEITYLLVRQSRPETIVEISPKGGWSTSWLLHAVNDNNRGTVYSYDLIDTARKLIPESLRAGHWVFEKGDVRSAKLPSTIDYLFIDSLHTGEFARWYTTTLFPRLSRNAPVSVDDVCRGRNTFFLDQPLDSPGPSEAEVVLSCLAARGILHFTVAPTVSRGTFNRVNEVRGQLGFGEDIHSSKKNQAVFFRWPGDR